MLSIILKGVAREYEGYSCKEIMNFIEADSITSEEDVSPGRTNTRIMGDDKEYVALNEKLSMFDTKFRAVNPELSNEAVIVNLHIDVEPQKNYKPGYPIEKRGIYDLLTLVIIRLGDSTFQEIDDKDKNGMMEFLHAIMYPHKKEFLDTVKKYIDFSENEELWKEVGNMSGLGLSIYEEILKEGLEEGLEKGRKQGRKEGLEEGREIEVFEPVQEEDYSIERGAQKLNITVEQLGEKMKAAGYKVPELI